MIAIVIKLIRHEMPTTPHEGLVVVVLRSRLALDTLPLSRKVCESLKFNRGQLPV